MERRLFIMLLYYSSLCSILLALASPVILEKKVFLRSFHLPSDPRKEALNSRHLAFRSEDAPGALSGGQNCGTSPINSDCGFDALLDQQIGTVDITDFDTFDRMYKNIPNIVIADDMPLLSSGDGINCPRGQHCKRQAIRTSMYEEVLSRFQNSIAQITTAANKAYYVNSSSLIFGYNDTNLSMPEGYTICTPLSDPWTWCDSSGNVVPDNITTSISSALSALSATEPQGGFSRLLTCSTASNASCPDTAYASITSILGISVLHHAPNGNIYSFSEDGFQQNDNLTLSRLFAGSSPWIVGSSGGRLLHSYRDSMDAWGVSRLRISAPEEMPKTGLPIALVPATNPMNQLNPGSVSNSTYSTSIATAVDTSARVYYLITCSYADSYSKIFLAKDLVDGPETLKSDDVVGNVTAPGAKPDWCGAVTYSSGNGPL